jgi:formylglycine-generating enzyme
MRGALTATMIVLAFSAGAEVLRILSFETDGTIGWVNMSTDCVAVVESCSPESSSHWVTVYAGLPTGTISQVEIVATNESAWFRALNADNTATPPGMALIPAGSFSMGDILGDEAHYPEYHRDETPVHEVYISAFYMDRYEVTKAMWDEIATWAMANGYDFWEFSTSGKGPDHPVHRVSWYTAVKWCNARSEREGKTPAYYTSSARLNVYRTGNVDVLADWVRWDTGYRLPTEAEWEKAARGGLRGQRFPWGADINHDHANYRANGSAFAYDTSPYTKDTLHPDYDQNLLPYNSPVGTFAPNGYGLYDMAGNAKEWCWDWYDRMYYMDSPGFDPRGPTSGQWRAIRSGSWDYSAMNCRVANRDSFYPVLGYDQNGFRCVLPAPEPEEYLEIDLSGGAQANHFPVSTLASTPFGGWSEEHRTTKLVLRRFPAGTFTMGSPGREFGRERDSDEYPHQVTHTQGFYIGVFEVTQQQWYQVMGEWPSFFTNAAHRASRPVEQVSYADIRGSATGAGWPNSAAADADSFLGRLRQKTGLTTLDLPSEAQWEYACRAGTATALNSGKNLTSLYDGPNMDEVGRYWYNGGSESTPSGATAVGTTRVGGYLANQWGLYDMHGNVEEWCLDWYGLYADAEVEVDPVGAESGSNRVKRGGSWQDDAQHCRSAYRSSDSPSSRDSGAGFRVVGTIP